MSIELTPWVWLIMILTVSPPYHDAMPILPYSHLSQQNLADNGRAKNKVNPTKVYEQIPCITPSEAPSMCKLPPKSSVCIMKLQSCLGRENFSQSLSLGSQTLKSREGKEEEDEDEDGKDEIYVPTLLSSPNLSVRGCVKPGA